MKKILLTGRNSSIGRAFEKYINNSEKYSSDILIERISIRDTAWQEASWESYDAILHVAGYAKSDDGHISIEEQQKYYDINVELTQRVACKAKRDGVRYFIYLSTMMVYGNSTPFYIDNAISKKTPPKPQNYYGKSKLEAEDVVKSFQSDDFKVLIIREPIVYGEGLDGEIPRWLGLSRNLLFFPKLSTTRSSIYIWNLCELFRLCIEQERTGTICPRNTEQYSLSMMIKIMRELQDKRTIIVPGCSVILRVVSMIVKPIRELLGTIYYVDDMVDIGDLPYNIYSTEESYKRMLECR